jgi:hypothetical protein
MEEEKIGIVPTCNVHKESTKNNELLEFYKINKNDKEEEDPRNVHVSKIEGEHDIVGLELESNTYINTLRVKKLNISTEEKPKFENIGDY